MLIQHRSFGTDVRWLWPSSKKYSQENLDVASKHVDSFQANYGGTEIYRALHSVLNHYNMQNDVPTNVILLTDGEVWDVDRVIQLVRRTVSGDGANIRFFSLGIGDRVSHRLVEGNGQQGGGYAEIVPESSIGSWQERVIQIVKAALTPSRLQCSVDLGKDLATKTSEREIAGYRVQYPEWIRAPDQIPVLNTFSHFSLYYMLESGLDSLPKTINITATTDKGEKLTAELPIQAVAEQPAIHHLAAKALMNDFETGQSWLHSLNPTLKTSNQTGFEKVLGQEAQRLGQMWSIPSKWTSYVAIDRTTTEQHAISVHKADAIEVSQLTRLRPAPILLRQSSEMRCKRSNYRSTRAIEAQVSKWAVAVSGGVQAREEESSLSNSPDSPHDESQLTSPVKRLKRMVHYKSTRTIDTAESGHDSRRATPQDAYPISDEGNDLAGRVQISQGDVPIDLQGRLPSSPASEEETASYGRPKSYLNAAHPDSPNSPSLGGEVSNPEHTPPPDFPALETILREQRADGEFYIPGLAFDAMRAKYNNKSHCDFLHSRFNPFNPKSKVTKWRLLELYYHILIVVHITHKHAASKALWELQVAKAQKWIKRTIVELLKESGNAEETPERSLEELAESIVGEMEKQVSQET